MIKLKRYQEKSLDILRSYLETARFKDAKQAYEEIQHSRYQSTEFKPFQHLDGLEDVPYVCLRLPTGGGKTLLSTHTIRLAGNSYIENDYPLTLWLVPTNTIKFQTLEVLKTPGSVNRKVLEDAFNGRFRVFDIADFRQIRPQDITDGTCIVVSTFASLRVDATEGRKVYAHDENLEPHFVGIPAHIDGMERDEKSGQIKFSFANLLYWHRPLVIVDEAHNAKSKLSVEVLNRVNATCIVEYTATPAKNSNIIHSVSAAELKAEEMIKLPIILSEHMSWEQAVTASIQTRKKLEKIAREDDDYIRPIILFQAEDKGKEVTVEVLKKYLLENEDIDPSQIVVATGEENELDSVNLFDKRCPVRYVITIQALKEGWDCSFAYVLCSVASTKSPTTVEQLLGRVLRMPYAKTRTRNELNKAYAHVSSQSWPQAVKKLQDHLVEMGFERQEAEEVVYKQPTEFANPADQQQKSFEVSLTEEPNLSKLNIDEQSRISVEEISPGKFVMSVTGDIDKNLLYRLSESAANKKDNENIEIEGNIYIKRQDKNLPPSQRREVFSIPQLCLNLEGKPELAEKELFLGDDGWNLLDYYEPLSRDHFMFDDRTKQYIVDVREEKISVKFQNQQSGLGGINTEMPEDDLCRWLDRKLQTTDINQKTLLEFLRRAVRDLLTRDDINMQKLVLGKFVLERVLRERINTARKEACKKAYESYMFGSEAIATVDADAFQFVFPEDYPANRLYEGSIDFNKHFYPLIGEMNGEEAECAQAIDSHCSVKFWVRNLERQEYHSFWLPTSVDKFYPDFVAQLNDGRSLVVEYKGSQFRGTYDVEEKKSIGKLWAEKSGFLFHMAWQNDDGLDVNQQINKVLAN